MAATDVSCWPSWFSFRGVDRFDALRWSREKEREEDPTVHHHGVAVLLGNHQLLFRRVYTTKVY